MQVSKDIQTLQAIKELQARLHKIHGLTQHVADRVDGIYKILTKPNRKQSMVPAVSDKLVRQDMPLKPRIFHGRDTIVQELVGLLLDEELPRICILGPGGMGKTSLALAVVQSPSVQAKYNAHNCFWVPCIEATSTSLFLQILCTHLRVTVETSSPLNDILAELKTTVEPRLILLDNFETPWNTLDNTQKDVNNVIQQLDRIPHVAILVTMRGTHLPSNDIVWQSKNLPPTDKDACRRIFSDINPDSKDDPDVDHLLTELGYMPFAVTLMANLGKEGQSSAKHLLEEWRDAGPRMLSPSQVDSSEKSMNKSISLSVDSNLVKRDPDALFLLATLSLLPAGTSRENLHWWAPSLKLKTGAIARLSRAALLTPTSSTLFVLPVVQSFMHHHHRIPDEVHQQVQSACCQYVLDHACRYRDSKFKTNSEALASEDTNIQSILLGGQGAEKLEGSCDRRLVEALVAFSWHRYDTKPNLEIVTHTLELARASRNQRRIVESLICLGGTHSKLNDFNLAKPCLQEAWGSPFFSAKNLSSGPICRRLRVECAWLLAGALRHLHEDPQEIIALLESVNATLREDSDEEGRARTLSALGHSLRYAKKYDDALNRLFHARAISVELGHNADAAKTLNYIARVYRETARPEKAICRLDQALELIQEIDDPYIHGGILLTYGTVLLDMNRNAEAMEYLMKALCDYQLLGSVLGLAQTLEYIGYTYLRMNEYQEAATTYQEATERYVIVGAKAALGQAGKEQCRRNLDLIKRKQKNQHEIVEFLRPTGDEDGKCLLGVSGSE